MHYERFRDHNYLGAWDFEDGDRIVTIDRVEQGIVEREKDDPERVPLVYLEEYELPFILNSTNGFVISNLYGTTDTRKWEGKRIILTRGMTTNKQGHPCWGIRVALSLPPAVDEPAESEADRIARLEAELAKARAAARPTSPAELPPRPPISNTVPAAEEVTDAALRA